MEKNIIHLEIAGFVVKIMFHEAEWDYVKEKFKREFLTAYKYFIINSKQRYPNYTIHLKSARKIDLLIQQKKVFIEFFKKIKPTFIAAFYENSIIQTQIIIRNILLQLFARRSGFILHASASTVNNQAVIFLAQPGGGKSTAMKLLDKVYPALADDSCIIKKEKGIFYFYQTPFIEKESWVKKTSEKYKIAKVFFLEKANFFKIEKIKNKELVLKKIIKQFWTEAGYSKKQMQYIFEFVRNSDNFYTLFFKKNKKFGEFIEESM